MSCAANAIAALPTTMSLALRLSIWPLISTFCCSSACDRAMVASALPVASTRNSAAAVETSLEASVRLPL
jgi:hypothetical protein